MEGRIEHNGDLRLRMHSDYAAGVIDKVQYAELARAVDARLQCVSSRLRFSKEQNIFHKT